MNTQFSLTVEQRRCFDAIVAFHAAAGQMPTFGELCAALDLKSKSGITRLLNALEERGYIKRLHGRERAIALVEHPQMVDLARELKPSVAARLTAYCLAQGEPPGAVINDILSEFFDREAGACVDDAGVIIADLEQTPAPGAPT